MSPEARRRLVALLRSAGGCYGVKWRRVLRVVYALPEGDEVDRELGEVLLAGDWDAYDRMLEALAREDEDDLRMSALDLVTEVSQRKTNAAS